LAKPIKEVIVQFKIMASRHSAFYTPLLTAIQFLRDAGHDASYSVLARGQRSHELIRTGAVDIMQSAVSSNWPPREKGISPLPVHFAQINCRDGFFLAGRRAEPFAWKNLEGKTLLADHGVQPLAMLKYALRYNQVEWDRIHVIDAGTPAEMEAAFRSGTTDYIHSQAPIASGEYLVSVGVSMPPVAFSSLCCARAYQQKPEYRVFLDAFARSKEWSRSATPAAVAAREAAFFEGVPITALADAIWRYQAVGNWDGGLEIPRKLYEQALTVFESAGVISRRHPYEEVVG
jgi:NitT/TauT family transport system substrate-binding protein